MHTVRTAIDRKYKKVANRNHRAKEYKDCTEKYNRGVQQQPELKQKAVEHTPSKQQKEKNEKKLKAA